MSWSWPQYAYLALSSLGLYFNAKRHGTVDYAPQDSRPIVIATLVSWALLWAGGFFAM